MSTRIPVVVLASALTFPASLFAFRPEARDVPHVAVADDADAGLQSYVDAMNRERIARGEKPLRLNHQLCSAANDRVRDMFKQHYFAHDAPDGTDPFTWFDREGYDYSEAGENLAVGYVTANDTVDGWMHSPGHRANILNKAFEEVGVAVAPGSPKEPFRGPLVVAVYGAR